MAALAIAAPAAVAPAAAAAQATAPGEHVRVLTLEDALRIALTGSRELMEARLAVEEADGIVSEARSRILPRVELNTGYTRNLTAPSSFLPAFFFDPSADPDELVRVSFGADNVWRSMIALEQPLFDARAFGGLAAARQHRALQQETLRGRLLQVATRLRILYYSLLLAQEQARLFERSLERVVESLDETRALQRAGLASDYDVLRLEVELAGLEPQLRRAVNQARAHERELVTELDLDEDTRLQLVGDLARLDLEDPAANDADNRALLAQVGAAPAEAIDDAAGDELFQRARVRSSELLQLERLEGVRAAELRLERAELLPQVSLVGSYEVQAQQDGRPEFFGRSGLRAYGRTLGVQVSMPLFTGFERRARTAQRRTAVRRVRIERELLEDRTRDRIRTLLEEVVEARLRSRGQRLAVAQARRGFEIASSQYREGLSSQLELTDAEVALRQSEFNYAQAVFDYLSSRARLDELLGEVPLPTDASHTIESRLEPES